MNAPSTSRAGRVRQRGVSLIVVMMVLVIVTILGIGAAQISMMGERGARNDRDMQLALQSAEAALMDAAFEIDGPPSVVARSGSFDAGSIMDFREGCGTGTSKGLCTPSLSGKPIWQQVDFSDHDKTVAFGEYTGRAMSSAGDAGAELGVMPAMKPRYVVEALKDGDVFDDPTKPPRYMYRVTAIGYGPRESIQAVVQMLYRKKKD
ncbi:MAG: PilX N-terminal domain-containing pilus assembly protein [Variovorax sp.]